ncbi:apiosidase-like domain-containing protein [Tunicatimonas pelagia]|uniref:apiosidase-like domain-containing protein n=1 Tax=Tunicatimonas pelagia TaxID=931531 RepID=UPI00266680EF|nr:DUF4038 domain-containing protein [Tunicatimonas pelagia]WKN46116.1 DUF4038 domain-containing protein [Tunicatimonas pelagia]
MQPLFFLFAFFLSAQGIAQTVFPLSISENQRYLVNAEETPFLYQADTPWFLFFKLTMPEVKEYMLARKAQGFNTLQIMLTGGKDLENIYGELPFDNNYDLAQPNEKFFQRVDSIVVEAQQQNLLLAIVPLWSGCCREDYAGQDSEGNPLPLNRNGVEKARAYGEWVGNRYGNYDHIMWVLGGDNDPFNALEEIEAMAEGLHQTSNNQLFTYHASSTHSSTDVFPDADWLDVSMVYTYFRGFNKAWNKIQPDVYEVCYDEYQKTPALPFFLGESTYEGEHDNWGSALQARKQAYWAVLSGATGHAYGSPNWHLRDDWREVLQFPGAESLKHLPPLMQSFGWPHLQPDWLGTFIIREDGGYATNDYAVTAFSTDSSQAITYVPSGRELQVDLSILSSEAIELSWFNPRSGETTIIETSSLPAKPTIATPDQQDWILLSNAQ